MSNVAHVQSAAPARRGLAQFFAALANAIETAFDVFGEAGDMSAEARQRFPLAD